MNKTNMTAHTATPDATTDPQPNRNRTATRTTKRTAFAAIVTIAALTGTHVAASQPQQTADTIHVTQTGNNANPGTAQAPLRTVEHALTVAGPGDTIVIGAGSWPPLTITDKHGAPGNPITLRSGTPDQVWFGNNPTPDRVTGVTIERSSHLVLDDINTRQGLWGMKVRESSHLAIRNSEHHTFGQEAITFEDNSHTIVFEHNHVHNTGKVRSTYGEGLYIGNSTATFKNAGTAPSHVHTITIAHNTIRNTTGEALDIKGGTSGLIIEHNQIHDITTANSAAIAFHVGALDVVNARSVIRHNRIWNITRTSQWTDGNAISVSNGDIDVHDNVIHNVQHRGILVNGDFYNPEGRNVRIFNNHITNWGIAAIEQWGPNPNPVPGYDSGRYATWGNPLPARAFTQNVEQWNNITTGTPPAPTGTVTAPTTTVPATTAPATTVPAPTVPATTAPVTTVPAPTVPATTAPVATVPATTVPVTTVPVTTVPVTTVPVTKTPVATTPATAPTTTPATVAPTRTTPRKPAPVTTNPKAPALVGASSSNNWAGDNISWPTGITNGDVAVAVLTMSHTATNAHADGWNTVTMITNTAHTNGYSTTMWVGTKVLNGTETGDIGNWTVTNGKVSHGTVMVYRNVNRTNPVDATGQANYTHIHPFAPHNAGVTTRTPNATIITVVAPGGSVAIDLPDTRYAQIVSRDDWAGGEHIHTRTQPTPGPSGPVTWQTNSPQSTGWYTSYTFALAPA